MNLWFIAYASFIVRAPVFILFCFVFIVYVFGFFFYLLIFYNIPCFTFGLARSFLFSFFFLREKIIFVWISNIRNDHYYRYGSPSKRRWYLLSNRWGSSRIAARILTHIVPNILSAVSGYVPITRPDIYRVHRLSQSCKSTLSISMAPCLAVCITNSTEVSLAERLSS